MTQDILDLMDKLNALEAERLDDATMAMEEVLDDLRQKGDLVYFRTGNKAAFVFTSETLAQFVKRAAELIGEKQNEN